MLDKRMLSSWDNINETPYYFFYYYVPIRYLGCSDESQKVRTLIWDFKDGRNQDEVTNILEKKLKDEFKDLSNLIFVCIPASTRMANEKRYKNFSTTLCSKLNIGNAFSHISIVKEKEPKHLGGTGSSTYKLDKDFFKGKQVILFDDIVTRGSSMQSFISYLEESGAKTACCISIGKTYWDKIMPDSVRNPWSGKFVFSGYMDDESTENDVTDEKIDSVKISMMTVPDILKASSEGRINDVKFYLSKNGDTEIKDKFGRTPLINAVINGNLEIVKVLTDSSANIEYCWNGVTPLYLAAQKNHKDVFAFLCERKANVGVVDDTGMSIRELCVKRDYKDILSILNRYDKNFIPYSVNMTYDVGDMFFLGRYQNKKLDWIILDKDEANERYLAIARYGIECMRFYDTKQFITWDKSSIRKWLNVEFLANSFSNEEKGKILSATYEANDNPIYGSNQGSDTQDRISILNITQYNKYFNIYNKWDCRLFSGIKRQCWLRNSGNDNCHAAFIGRSGSIHAGGSNVDSPRNAVRPIIWVRL